MDGDQHAGSERCPVGRVVPDGEGLPRTAEEHLLVGDQPATASYIDLEAYAH